MQVARKIVVAGGKSKHEFLIAGEQYGRLSVTTLRRNEHQSTYRQCDYEKFFHTFLPFVCCFARTELLRRLSTTHRDSRPPSMRESDVADRAVAWLPR